MNWLMQFEVIGEVALAMLLGGVIGVVGGSNLV